MIPEIARNIIKREDYDKSEYNTRFYDDIAELMEKTSFLITAYLAGRQNMVIGFTLFEDDGDS